MRPDKSLHILNTASARAQGDQRSKSAQAIEDVISFGRGDKTTAVEVLENQEWDCSSRALDGQIFGNVSLTGKLVANDSEASTEPKESIASNVSPTLDARSLSNTSIAHVEHTKSTSTSTSSPVVKRETHTDPVTGELTIIMTTTIVTTTTTTRTIKIPPPTQDGVNLDEERRLATEYLASNGLASPRPQPGLQPAPRRSESHSNLIGRAADQSFGPRPSASRSYSMGSRTGPPPSFTGAPNFSRPGLRRSSAEPQMQAPPSMDARKGARRAELIKSKSLILRKPGPKPDVLIEQNVPALERQPNHSPPENTTTIGIQHARPHTTGGGEKCTANQPRPTFPQPQHPYPPSPPADEPELISPRRGSWGTFGAQGAKKHQKITNNFILGIPSTGDQSGNMF
ncbi:hypothetical protein diail_3371 [Diaporthe ilicicola]|nr:hypothetical protein diail_3371 [Diaporthe ilicicola]